ncbi:hypothetical protein [Rhodococcus globerulus]|uniref:hypothetical protein n=1 Tax=Rhodococcus globerulus TaxID=33008 RepID=UPI001C564166|nr:hypothetical protein [Rhodococcus globerulus]QXW01320.1 hypothetical protein KYT97_23740 [Rhodococcus globerulus]
MGTDRGQNDHAETELVARTVTEGHALLTVDVWDKRLAGVTTVDPSEITAYERFRTSTDKNR